MPHPDLVTNREIENMSESDLLALRAELYDSLYGKENKYLEYVQAILAFSAIGVVSYLLQQASMLERIVVVLGGISIGAYIFKSIKKEKYRKMLKKVQENIERIKSET